ncbi:MAG TPA: DNA-binding protein, partial [Halieaceae bacterium]|nr:DNA-binding protein [Halieaceae bacterium]
MAITEKLSQEFELGFTYTRSTGPVVGRFLTGLRDSRVLGIR